MIPRYSRPEMTAIWTAESKFQIWLDIETHACDAQVKLGVIPDSAAKAIRKHGAFEVAETLKIIDKNPVLGPLVKAYDSPQAATTATDDLANIAATNLPDGSLLFLFAANTARAAVVKHGAGGAGQISLVSGTDFSSCAAPGPTGKRLSVSTATTRRPCAWC